MENKKSLSMILILVISTHLYLFAQLKVEEEPIVVAPKATNTKEQINLKNVILKKQEVKRVEKPIEKKLEKVVKKEIKKPLPKTESTNIIKSEKKKRKKKIDKKVHKKEIKKIKEPIEKVVKAEPIKEVSKEKVIEKTISQKVETKKEEINPEVLKSVENEYLHKLKKIIEKNKTYPNSAKRLNQTGKVYLSFTIEKNGNIANVFISKNSQFNRLNEATAQIMSKIQKFEPIPKELNKSKWEITVPVIYQIVRS